MSKSVQIMAIAVSFVALTLVSGVVYADEKNGKPFEAIWESIHNLESTQTKGFTNVYRVVTVEAIDNNPSQINELRVTCNPGDKVLGGGVGSLDGITIIADKPSGDDGWLGIFKTLSGVPKDVTVEAICVTP